MKPWLALAFALPLAACTDDADRFTGSYDGTLTISATGAPTVASAAADLLPAVDGAEIVNRGGSTDISCSLNGLGHTGDTVTFRCAELGCSCTVSAMDLIVTTASGTLVDDHLTLAFSGTTGANDAFSASFAGDLEPGTR